MMQNHQGRLRVRLLVARVCVAGFQVPLRDCLGRARWVGDGGKS